MSVFVEVKYTILTGDGFVDLKIEATEAMDIPVVDVNDPAIFVFRKVGDSNQFSNVAYPAEMLQYPDDPAQILPKTDQKFFRQSQVVIRKSTIPELERVRTEIDKAIARLIRLLTDELEADPEVTVLYGERPADPPDPV